MSSSFSQRMRKLPSRILNRIVHCCDDSESGSGEDAGAADALQGPTVSMCQSIYSTTGSTNRVRNKSTVCVEEILSEQERRVLRNLLSHKINMDFILEMKEAFQMFDRNGDGFINGKELGVLMRTLGHNPTEGELLDIIAEVDVDHNRKLDFFEFTVMMNDKLVEEELEVQIKQALRVFDGNGDGFVSKAEFKRCMMHFTGLTDEDIEEMLSDADLGGNSVENFLA